MCELAAKITSALTTAAPSAVVDTRREYSTAGITIIYKRRGRQEGSGLGSATQGSWRRVASWSSTAQAWDFIKEEMQFLGMEAGEVAA